MKNSFKLILLAVIVSVMSSCLDGNSVNTPIGASPSLIVMSLVDLANGGTTLNSGLNYFGKGALTYPASDASDTATFWVTLQGPAMAKDLNVTLKVDGAALNDNFSKDSITYLQMPDSVFKFINTTGVIKAGQNSAQFKVIFHPNKIDPTKNFMLAVTATNDANVNASGNYGHIYFHAIGNPLAGSYTWNFRRHNCQDSTTCGLSGASFFGATAVFAPQSPTAIKVPTGYYVQPNYLITFKNSSGVLSNFKAVIAPDEVDAAFTANGITIVTPPVITVSPDYKRIDIDYVVFNGSAYRNCYDRYIKQ